MKSNKIITIIPILGFIGYMLNNFNNLSLFQKSVMGVSIIGLIIYRTVVLTMLEFFDRFDRIKKLSEDSPKYAICTNLPNISIDILKTAIQGYKVSSSDGVIADESILVKNKQWNIIKDEWLKEKAKVSNGEGLYLLGSAGDVLYIHNRKDILK